MKRPVASAVDTPATLFVREDKLWIVTVSAAVITLISSHRQRRLWSCEAGGQLFGTIAPGYITVTTATGPSPKDWRGRFGFKPSRAREQADILRHFEQGLHFLGDWHTHPEPTPEPSGTDRDSLAEEFAQSEHQLPFFLLLIAGTQSEPRTWWLSSHRDRQGQRFFA
jgi:integrative and conjugative element protein (TIGR02256 family)